MSKLLTDISKLISECEEMQQEGIFNGQPTTPGQMKAVGTIGNTAVKVGSGLQRLGLSKVGKTLTTAGKQFGGQYGAYLASSPKARDKIANTVGTDFTKPSTRFILQNKYK